MINALGKSVAFTCSQVPKYFSCSPRTKILNKWLIQLSKLHSICSSKMKPLNLLTFSMSRDKLPCDSGKIPRKQLLGPGPTVPATGRVNSHIFPIAGLSGTSWSLNLYVVGQRIRLDSTAKMRAKASMKGYSFGQRGT